MTDREQRICKTFDNFCKRVIRNAARDFFRCLSTRVKHTVPLEQVRSALPCTDTYFYDPRCFRVFDYEIVITRKHLADALLTLTRDKLNVILLTCCADLPDREVAQMLRVVRRIVAYKRAKALQELRRALHAMDY